MNRKEDKWGFGTEKSNVINLDVINKGLYNALVKKVPGLKACFYCGSCSATCTTSDDGMNLRMVNLLIRRGDTEQFDRIIRPCILCGKCTLACPRDVDTRSVIFNLRILRCEHL